MKFQTSCLFALTLLSPCFSHASFEKVEAAINQARAYLGGEAALKAVEGIQYRGKVILYQGETPMEGNVILTFQKPYSQKIEFIFADQSMVTGFSGYEGYEYVERTDPDGETVRNIRSIGGSELRRNKAASIENLSFFKPFALSRETIKDHGLVEFDGVSARKIDFIHWGMIVFTRYFDSATGDLIKSELDTGIVTIETGEIISEGIRFSDHVEGIMKGEVLYEMNFEEIIINPEIEDTFFDYPNN